MSEQQAAKDIQEGLGALAIDDDDMNKSEDEEPEPPELEEEPKHEDMMSDDDAKPQEGIAPGAGQEIAEAQVPIAESGQNQGASSSEIQGQHGEYLTDRLVYDFQATVEIDIQEAIQQANSNLVTLEGFMEGIHKIKFKPSDIPVFANLIEVASSRVLALGLVAFRRVLSIPDNPPIEQVIATGKLPKIIQMLAWYDQPKLQFESAWIICNIASGENQFSEVLAQHNAILPLITLLQKTQITTMQEQVVWALGNLGGSTPLIRDKIIAAGAIPIICEIQDQITTDNEALRNINWTLCNLVRGKPQPSFQKVKRALPTILKTIKFATNIEVLTDACWGLSYLSDGAQDGLNTIVESESLPRLVALIQHPTLAIMIPALRTCGNLLTGEDAVADKVLSMGFLQSVIPLLDHHKTAVRREVCWCVSNVAAGSNHQTQQLIDCGLIEAIIKKITSGTESEDVLKEAIWVAGNLAQSCSLQQLQLCRSLGMEKALATGLTFNDNRQKHVAVEGIHNLLTKCKDHPLGEQDIIAHCSSLQIPQKILSIAQNHSSTQALRGWAKKVLEEFFPELAAEANQINQGDDGDSDEEIDDEEEQDDEDSSSDENNNEDNAMDD